MVESTTLQPASWQNPEVTPRQWCTLGASMALASGAFWEVERLGCRTSSDQPRRFVRELAEVGARPFEGRLAGQPWLPVADGFLLSAAQRERLNRLGGAASDAHRRRPGPEHGHSLGLALLFSGRPDKALERLEEVSRLAPADSALTVDRSVVLLEQVRQGEASLWARALGATIEAARLAPESLEAQFNLALALERSSLLGEAAEAWQKVVDSAEDDDWRREAEEHLAAVQAPTEVELAPERRKRIEAAALRGNERQVAERVAENRQDARLFGERQLLARWANAESAGRREEAQQVLSLARRLGELLRAMGGDPMLAEGVAAVEAASGSRRRALARGHQALGRAFDAFPRRCEAALPDLAAAERSLGQVGSPFRLWARALAASCRHLSGDFAPAKALIAGIKAAQQERYPALAGHCHWTLGLIATHENRIGLSQDHFRAALVAFEGLKEDGHLASISFLAGENAFDLGQRERAWELLAGALSRLGQITSPRQRHNLLFTAARFAEAEGELEVALEIEVEVLGLARLAGLAEAEIEVLRLRAHALTRTGDEAGAAVERGEARKALVRVPSDAVRARLAADLDLDESRLLLADDPAAALRRLDAAGQGYRQADQRVRAIEVELVRAEASRSLGDRRGEDLALDRALDEAERIHADVTDPTERLALSRVSRQLYRARLAKDFRDEVPPAESLAHAERGKAQALRQAFGQRPEVPGTSAIPKVPADLGARWPVDVVLVEYAELAEGLAVWVVADGRVQAQRLPCDLTQVASQLAELRALFEDYPSAQILEQMHDRLGELHQCLLAPIREWLPPGRPLVIVPDGVLAGVPFAALWDPREERHLVEERQVTMAASGALYLAQRARMARGRNELLARPLAGAVPVAASLWGLDALSHVDDEVAALTAALPATQELASGGVTGKALLAGLEDATLLHLASHAVVHPKDPSLTLLLLDPEPGALDGSLSAGEIATWRPSKLKLAVLSACGTAYASDAPWDGAASLAAAFQMAGAPQTIGSLWPAGDESASKLFAAFYESLKQGSSPENALRLAQFQLLDAKDPELSTPEAWAGFALWGGTTAVD